MAAPPPFTVPALCPPCMHTKRPYILQWHRVCQSHPDRWYLAQNLCSYHALPSEASSRSHPSYTSTLMAEFKASHGQRVVVSALPSAPLKKVLMQERRHVPVSRTSLRVYLFVHPAVFPFVFLSCCLWSHEPPCRTKNPTSLHTTILRERPWAMPDYSSSF